MPINNTPQNWIIEQCVELTEAVDAANEMESYDVSVISISVHGRHAYIWGRTQKMSESERDNLIYEKIGIE